MANSDELWRELAWRASSRQDAVRGRVHLFRSQTFSAPEPGLCSGVASGALPVPAPRRSTARRNRNWELRQIPCSEHRRKSAPLISRNTYFGRPARWEATVLLKLLPLLASQFVDQSMAPRSDGYLATGL